MVAIPESGLATRTEINHDCEVGWQRLASVAKWEEDFEKDRDPESELQTWESIADAYQIYCSSQSLNITQKTEVIKLLLVRSGTPTEQEVLKRTPVAALTPTQAATVVRAFKGTPAPIEVEHK